MVSPIIILIILIRRKLGYWALVVLFIFVVLLHDLKKAIQTLIRAYCQHETCNLNSVCNGCAMVAKPGIIVLIIKVAS